MTHNQILDRCLREIRASKHREMLRISMNYYKLFIKNVLNLPKGTVHRDVMVAYQRKKEELQ